MKQKIIYIAIIAIVLSVLFVLFRPIKSSAPNTETKTETTYSTGKTEQLYKKGKDSVSQKTKSFHNKVIVRHLPKDTTYTFAKTDSIYNLFVNIKPETDSTFSLEYFLDLTSKDLVRVDTIYQLRIDTLKIKQTITERIEPPFYNTFLFGAITTALVVILLIHLIP
jgi:hypothetical protein